MSARIAATRRPKTQGDRAFEIFDVPADDPAARLSSIPYASGTWRITRIDWTPHSGTVVAYAQKLRVDGSDNRARGSLIQVTPTGLCALADVEDRPEVARELREMAARIRAVVAAGRRHDG